MKDKERKIAKVIEVYEIHEEINKKVQIDKNAVRKKERKKNNIINRILIKKERKKNEIENEEIKSDLM